MFLISTGGLKKAIDEISKEIVELNYVPVNTFFGGHITVQNIQGYLRELRRIYRSELAKREIAEEGDSDDYI